MCSLLIYKMCIIRAQNVQYANVPMCKGNIFLIIPYLLFLKHHLKFYSLLIMLLILVVYMYFFHALNLFYSILFPFKVLLFFNFAKSSGGHFFLGTSTRPPRGWLVFRRLVTNYHKYSINLQLLPKG